MRLLFTSAILATLIAAPDVMAQDSAPPAAPTASASATVTTKPQAPAVVRAEELDRLFAQLHTEGAEARASSVEQKIWANWGRNDSITAEVLLGQATKAMNAQEFPVAEEILDRLLTARPEYTEAWNRRATLNFLAQRHDKSLADIEKVLELEPRHFGALAGRGMIYEAQGKPDQALAAYREALAVNPHMQGVKDKVKLLEKQRPEI